VTCREPPDTHPRVTDVDANVVDWYAGRQPVPDPLPPTGGSTSASGGRFIRSG